MPKLISNAGFITDPANRSGRSGAPGDTEASQIGSHGFGSESAKPDFVNGLSRLNYPEQIRTQKDDLWEELPAVLAVAEKLIEEHGFHERALKLLFEATNSLSLGVEPGTAIRCMEHGLKIGRI